MKFKYKNQIITASSKDEAIQKVISGGSWKEKKIDPEVKDTINQLADAIELNFGLKKGKFSKAYADREIKYKEILIHVDENGINVGIHGVPNSGKNFKLNTSNILNRVYSYVTTLLNKIK